MATTTSCSSSRFGGQKEGLEVVETEVGFEQRSRYRQADLWHEEVVEVSSPFALSVKSETRVFTFLLLGDQNAGKSTLLHAFTYEPDPNVLLLTSSLPILSSSFLNSRFFQLPPPPPASSSSSSSSSTSSCKEESETERMRRALLYIRDQPPFIDTDVARGHFLLTLEDFRFFLEEHNLSLPPKKEREGEREEEEEERYVMIQFIEIGGDHLDRLMELHQQRASSSSSSFSPWLEGILDRTLQVLREAKKSIYFINAMTLLERKQRRKGSEEETVMVFRRSGLCCLLSRLAFLESSLPSPASILFYISRFPA
jgi:hypothetical protein